MRGNEDEMDLDVEEAISSLCQKVMSNFDERWWDNEGFGIREVDDEMDWEMMMMRWIWMRYDEMDMKEKGWDDELFSWIGLLDKLICDWQAELTNKLYACG